MKAVLLVFALVASVACWGQTRVIGYTPGQSEEGVTYYLPLTALHITVEVEKTTFVPGDFCRYAEKYLRLSDVSAQASECWDITKIRVTPVGEPDKDKMYTIGLRDKTVAPLVELTEDGILKAINTRYPEQADGDEADEQPAETPLNPRDYLVEDILMAGSTAKMAELTAREIYSIRESKNSLTRGQADFMPKDGESLKIMLANLDKQEKALMQLFVGKTVKEKRVFNLRLLPEGDMEKEVLFRFSKKLGVVSAENLAGEPVYVDLISKQNVPQASEEEKSKKKPDGVVYNIPGKASVVIYQGDKKYCEAELPFAQFGNSEVLSRKLFDKRTTTQVVFDPSTGAILRISADGV